MTPEKALAIYHEGPEAVVKVICELSDQIAPLKKQIATLKRKVAQLSKTSSNSSKPPSSDVTKPKSKNRQKGKRKIGAQKGHPKHQRPPFDKQDIDQRHEYRLESCPQCNNPEVTFVGLEHRFGQCRHRTALSSHIWPKRCSSPICR